MVSCLGHDYEEVLKALSEGKSGVRAVPEWEGKGLKSLVAGMIDNLYEKKEVAKLAKKLTPAMSDSALYCSLAARDAVAEADSFQ